MNRDPEHIRDEFSPLLDGELSDEERAAVEAQLANDADLLRELDSLKRVDRLYRAMPAEPAPEGFEERVRRALREPTPLMRESRPRFALWAAMAAAAALLVIAGGVLLSSDSGRPRHHLAKLEQEASGETAADLLRRAAPAPAIASQERKRMRESAVGAPEPTLGAADTADEPGVEHKAALSAAPPGAAPGEDAAAPNEAGRLLAKGEPARTVDESLLDVPASPALAPLREGGAGSERAGKDKGDETLQSSVAAGKETEVSPRTEGTEEAAPLALGGAFSSESRAPEDSSGRPAEIARGTVRAENTVTDGARADAEPPSPQVASAAAQAKPESAPERAGAVAEGRSGGLTAPPPSPAKAAEVADGVEKHLADRTFVRKDGVWRQKGYRDEKTVSLVRDEKALQDLAAKHKELAEIAKLDGRVIFRTGGTWYELAPPPVKEKPETPPSPDTD